MVFSLGDTTAGIGSLIGKLSGEPLLSGAVTKGLCGPLARDSNQADFSFSLFADTLSVRSLAR